MPTEQMARSTGETLRPYPAVSVVIPLFNEEDVVETTVRTVFNVLSGLSIPDQHEVLCVNDGSRDATMRKLLILRDEFPRLGVIGLSRNFGHQAAVTAGMDHARWGCRVRDRWRSSGRSDSPRQIHRGIQRRSGRRLCPAYTPKGVVSDAGGLALHYRLLSTMSSVDIPIDAGDFALVSRCCRRDVEPS